ncbi:MAG TPA: alpha/beta hydrolase [Acidimicrobiales bacterium]|nr:alpha/beta hydrolase [Acidimicrobiales bacterium]
MADVVLVHGFASSFEHNWQRTGWVDILGDQGREVVEVDLPGHGTSSRSTDPAAYADVAADVAAALPGEPVDAVGFSAGAEILVRIATRRPGAFRRLALLGVGDNLLTAGDPQPIIDALSGHGDPDDVRGELFRRLAESAGNDPEALVAFLRRPNRPFTEAELSTVTCPVLVVLGDRDFVGPADRLVQTLPDVTLVTLRGVDHFATPQDFGAIDAVMRFLDTA